MVISDEPILVQIRLPGDLVIAIDHVRVDLQTTRQDVYERLLRRVLRDLGDRAATELSQE